MAIPSKPLELTVTLNKLTLKEATIFDPTGFSLVRFRLFLIDHTNWSEAEIDEIEVGELKDIADQLSAAFKESAVPLANSPKSKTTRAKKAT